MIELLRDFHFLRPVWLLSVIPFVVTFLAIRNLSTLSGAWEKLIDPRLLSHLVVNRASSKWLRPVTLMLPVGIVGSIAMAGPTWELADSPLGPSESTLLIVLESGRTMAGVDVGPSRLERMKFKVRDLIDAKQAQRSALIVYGGSAHIVMPPTTDSEVLIPYLDALDPSLLPDDGDRLDLVPSAIERLGPSAIQGPTTLVIVSDGTTPEAPKAIGEWALANKVSVVLWAVGTSDGVPGESIPGWDLESLESVAQAADGEVIELSLGESDIRQILRVVSRQKRDSADPSDDAIWKDEGYFLVFPLLLWVLLWFRRGWVVRVGAVTMIFMLGGCGDTTFADLWMTRNMQGRFYFEKGDYKTAAERFEDPMWRGLSAYAAEDWQGAIDAFSAVKSAEGYYNLGNAYGQWNRQITAIQAYDKALAQNPTFKEARINRDMFQHNLDTMQESDELEELSKGPAKNRGEKAVELKEKQKLDRDSPKNPLDQIKEGENSALDELSNAMNDAWMRRVATKPKDFLRIKFSSQPQDSL